MQVKRLPSFIQYESASFFNKQKQECLFSILIVRDENVERLKIDDYCIGALI